MVNTEFAEQIDKGLHVRWLNAINIDRAAHNRGGGGECSRLNAVRHDVMARTVQPVNTLNLNAVGLGSCDLRAHCVEQRDQIVDFGLLRRRRDDGGPLRKDGGEDRVLGTHHGDLREGDGCPLKATVALRKVVAVAIVDLGAEGAHGVNVQVYGATTDAITTGVANDHAAKARQERSQEHEAGAHLRRRLKRHKEPFGVGCLQDHRLGSWSLDGHADVTQGVGKHIDVKDPWDVLEVHALAGQHRGGHHLEGGVLGAAHPHAASERLPALNAELLLREGDRSVLP